MTIPEEIRVFRYHMTSGHLLQEIIDSSLDEIDDKVLLEKVARQLIEQRYIIITEHGSESQVLVATDQVELVQVGHAALLISAEVWPTGAGSEDAAVQRARLRLIGETDAS